MAAHAEIFLTSSLRRAGFGQRACRRTVPSSDADEPRGVLHRQLVAFEFRGHRADFAVVRPVQPDPGRPVALAQQLVGSRPGSWGRRFAARPHTAPVHIHSVVDQRHQTSPVFVPQCVGRLGKPGGGRRCPRRRGTRSTHGHRVVESLTLSDRKQVGSAVDQGICPNATAEVTMSTLCCRIEWVMNPSSGLGRLCTHARGATTERGSSERQHRRNTAAHRPRPIPQEGTRR